MLNELAKKIHTQNKKTGWWPNVIDSRKMTPGELEQTANFMKETFGEERMREIVSPKNRNYGELLCLVHSELSEAMEGDRKNLMDDHLPNRKMAEVEIADAMIRIFDMCGAFEYDIEGAINEKFEYNKKRADHKLENRMLDGGKKY